MMRAMSCSALLTFVVVLWGAPPIIDAADWPQWRGPNRDGVSEETGLLKAWPAKGPKVVWQVESVGVGYSSIAVSEGRIFTQGDLNGVEHVIALDAADGSVLWAVQPPSVARRLAERVAAEMKRLDKDADGRLSEVEAAAGLGSRFNDSDSPAAADQYESIAAARTRRLMAALDADQDGRLTYSEAGRTLEYDFANIDREDKTADAVQLARRRTLAFVKDLDKDGDGELSRDESRGSHLDRPFGRIDQRREGENRGDQLLTAEEIETYLAKSEAGRDGTISADELTAHYLRRYPGRDGILTATELRGHYGGYRNGMGDGPRGTPTVEGNRVYAEGGNGNLVCLDAATGKTIWELNLASDLEGRRPGWGYSESPLIDGQKLIVTPGGKAGTVAALDKLTGKVLWRSADVTEGAHYASPIAANLAGTRQFVVLASKSAFGVEAASGRKLWSYSRANNGTANCATPIAYNDHVFASSDYGTGGALVKISASGDAQRADEKYFEQKMRNHHGGIVLVGDYLYGYGSSLICMHYLTGKIAWADRGVGKGSLVYADGMLFFLSEGHTVGLIEATPAGYREHGRFKIERQGRPSWAHPVVSGGRLYIRDQQRLTAYDVSAK